MQEYHDTYFFNSEEALKIASEQNRFGPDGESLQVCYYDGKKLESDLVNLIHVPVDNLLEDLAQGRFRIPTKIDLNGLELSSVIKVDIMTNFNILLLQAKEYRQKYNVNYLKILGEKKLDFKEPLRFYLASNAQTQVMQFVSKSIAEALKYLGYNVYYDLYHGIEDKYCIKNLCNFTPHATININYINNACLHKNCFNFIWFQDPMPILKNAEKIDVRERDYIFHLSQVFEKNLKMKGVLSEEQVFCMNEILFKKDMFVQKEKKIVCIGSSYKSRIDTIKNDDSFDELFTEMCSVFDTKGCLTGLSHSNSDIKYFMQKYKRSETYISNIYAYLVRDYSIEKLCSIETEYTIEVYGANWENNKIINPYLKGYLMYEDLVEVYNSATYGFCTGTYLLMQKTLECAFCETIPLVLDLREDLREKDYEGMETILEFFTLNTLENILKQEVISRDFTQVRELYSYKHFARKIVDTIQEARI